MSELQAIARYTITAGNEDEVHALLPRLAAASRAEDGCLAFEAYRNLDDPRDVVLLERYESPASFAAHRETAHFQDLVLKRIVPLLDTRVVETFDVP
jgi:quinol monooxygenase YgiN